MSSFIKTYLKVFAVIGGIFLLIGLLFWGLYEILGQAAYPIAFVIAVVLMLSFAITASIEGH